MPGVLGGVYTRGPACESLVDLGDRPQLPGHRASSKLASSKAAKHITQTIVRIRALLMHAVDALSLKHNRSRAARAGASCPQRALPWTFCCEQASATARRLTQVPPIHPRIKTNVLESRTASSSPCGSQRRSQTPTSGGAGALNPHEMTKIARGAAIALGVLLCGGKRLHGRDS